MAYIKITDYITWDTATSLYSIRVGADAASIQSVIDTAPAGSTLQFGAGKFLLDEKLTIARSDIQITGSGADKTTVVGDKGLHSQIFFFVGAVDVTVGTWLAEPVEQGSHTLTIKDASGFHVGDTLYIGQSNDDAFVTANYPNILGYAATAENPLRESFGKITAINGNTVTLKQAVGYDMAAGSDTIVQKWDMLHDIGLSDMTITYNFSGTPDPDYIGNAIPSMDNADAVVMNMVKGASVTNVAIVNAASGGLEMRNALEAHVDGLTIDGAFNKDDSNGYGLHIAGSIGSTFENLTITDTRHAVVFSSWNAEIDNTVHVLYTNRDINYHGSDDYGNTVIVDRAEYRTPDDHLWALVGPGGQNHPATDISKNTTLFGYAVASDREETLYAIDTGARLYGRGGDDRLIGGHGADILSGGQGNDKIWGHGGADLFLHDFGDGVDTIYDFGADDTLALGGYFIADIGDVVINRTGADAEIVLMSTAGLVDKVILKGAAALPLDEGDIVFRFSSYATASIDVTLTPGRDVVQAGAGNDILRVPVGSLNENDVIALGLGTDTLRLERGTHTGLDTAILEHTSGIDVLDASVATVKGLRVTQGFIDTTDSGHLIIDYGSRSITGLDTSDVGGTAGVILEGNGTIYLSGGVNNAVTLDHLSTGRVNGGDGDDTFTIQARGIKSIAAGEGDDTFRLMGDYLSSSMKLNGSAGEDTVYFEQTVNLSSSDVKYLRNMDHLVFSGAGNYLSLTNTLMVTLEDVSGNTQHASLTIDVTEYTGSRILGVGPNMDADFIGTRTDWTRISLEGATTTVSGTAGRDMYYYMDESQFGGHITDFSTLLDQEDHLTFKALFDNEGLSAVGNYEAFSKGYLAFKQSGADTQVMFDRDGAAGHAFAAKTVVTLDDVLATDLSRFQVHV